MDPRHAAGGGGLFAHLLRDGATARVERFHLPGTHAMNLVIHGALAGGGPASPRFDPLGKGFAQMPLDLPVQVPAAWNLEAPTPAASPMLV